MLELRVPEPSQVPPVPSTLSATSLDGGGQHSGRSRMARALGRAAAQARLAVTRPAPAVEDLVRPFWFAGPPQMLHIHLHTRGATQAALDLDSAFPTLVVAAVPELEVGATVLAVLQLCDGTFLQLPAVAVRQGRHRLQLGFAELSLPARIQLKASLR